jgi:nucleoside-diphosphate-sugar epimerase
VLEAGGAVCNLIDVNNLARAIELGLDHCSSRSPRLFVTDDEDITWRQVIDGLSPLYGDLPEPPSIERIELERLRDALNAKPKVNIIRSLKHLVSSDIRAALRRDPLWARVDTALRSSVAKLGLALEDKIRLSIEGPMVVQKHSSKPNINIRLSAQQLRGVRHSSAVAKRTINYAPQYSFTDSMAAYRAWYRNHTGRNTPMWSLAQYLWT